MTSVVLLGESACRYKGGGGGDGVGKKELDE
jgi:hypothetical protein